MIEEGGNPIADGVYPEPLFRREVLSQKPLGRWNPGEKRTWCSVKGDSNMQEIEGIENFIKTGVNL